MRRKRYWGVVVLLLLPALKALSQAPVSPKVELFAGAELHYRDIFYTKMYEVLVNLTPGLKWHIGNRWQLAGQAIIPVYNDYGDRYKKVRLSMAVLSKESNVLIQSPNLQHFNIFGKIPEPLNQPYAKFTNFR